MKIIKNAVEYLNPGQAPVICLDQSLFAKYCKTNPMGEETHLRRRQSGNHDGSLSHRNDGTNWRLAQRY